MKKPAVIFGEEVRRARQARELSQEDLAERIGLSRVAVGDIERGETKRPSDATLEGLERVLGISRQRSYELLGLVPPADRLDPLAELYEIASLPTHEARMERWRQFPPEFRRALRLAMQDILHDAAQRLEE